MQRPTSKNITVVAVIIACLAVYLGFSGYGMLRVVTSPSSVVIGPISIDRADYSAHSVLQISSKRPLEGLDVAVEVSISEVSWDKKLRRFRENTYKKERLLVASDLSLPGDSKAVELPVQLPLPDRPSIWKVSMKTVVKPNVVKAAYSKPVIFNTYAPAKMAQGESFIIAVLPDTQYYSGYNPVVLDRMTHWLLEEADDKNISLALHVGDITDRNSAEHWENARASISQLNGVIPYVLTLGNHDMSPPGNAGNVAHRGESLFGRYFPDAWFTGLKGSFPPGRLDNTYHAFNIAGVDYLVVALEFAPPDEALKWANQVVASFPQHKTIVLTHAYLSGNGLRIPKGKTASSYAMGSDSTTTMNDGEAIWDKFVRNHENISIVVCGHINGVGVPWHIDKGVKGNQVIELLIDYQDRTEGWLALLEFTKDDIFNVEVYSPYLDEAKTDVNRYGFTNHIQVDMKTGRISDLY